VGRFLVVAFHFFQLFQMAGARLHSPMGGGHAGNFVVRFGGFVVEETFIFVAGEKIGQHGFNFLFLFFSFLHCPKKKQKSLARGCSATFALSGRFFILLFSFLHCPKKKQKSLARDCSATCSFSKLK